MSATAAVILTHTKVVRPIVACDARGTTKSSFSRASQFRRGRSYMRAHARLRCLFISPHGVSLFLASPIAPSWPVHARHLPGVKVNRRHPSLGPPRREDGFSSAARKEARGGRGVEDFFGQTPRRTAHPFAPMTVSCNARARS